MQSLFIPAILFPRVVSLWQSHDKGNICFGPVQTAGRRQAQFKRKSTTKKETQTSQMGCDLASAALPSSLHAMPPSHSRKVDGDSYSQPGPGQCSCLQQGLAGAVLPGHEKVEAIVPRGIWCRQGMQQQEGVRPCRHRVQRLWGHFARCQLGSCSLKVGDILAK